MVDYNLINSLGDMDDDVNAAVATALGDAANDITKLVAGDEVQNFTPGAILKGRVGSLAGDDFVIELGLKSEGILERNEFDEPENVKVGDEVKVLLTDVEGDSGLVKISKCKADRIINWETIMKSKKEGEPVSGKVTKKIKGGLLVDIGVPVFLPASQVDIRRPGEISDWLGRHIDAVILKIDEERRNIVISRRKLIEQQREELKKNTLDSLEVGQVRKGTVKNIADFARLSTWAESTGCCISRICPGAGSTTPARFSRTIRKSKSKFFRSTRTKRRSPWDSSRKMRPRGRISRRNTRWAPCTRPKSSTSCPTARSANWRKASKGWCISRKCLGPSELITRAKLLLKARKSKSKFWRLIRTNRKSPSA